MTSSTVNFESNRQVGYYKALQESHENGVDCRPFIDFMLDAIENSLYKFVDIATETRTDVSVNVGANVPVNVTIKPLMGKVLGLLRTNPKTTIEKLAQALGVTDRTIKRALKSLQDQNFVKRIGPDKTGHWEVLQPIHPPKR